MKIKEEKKQPKAKKQVEKKLVGKKRVKPTKEV